jgi:predicted RNase H-like nuclease (RuvC/YqgF family)
MKQIRGGLCLLAGLGVLAHVSAETIYRCGNTYTNRADSANCIVVPSANVTVIEGTKVYAPAADGRAPLPSQPQPQGSATATTNKIDPALQTQRDEQAQQVLQAELQKAQSQHNELQKQLDTLSSQANQSAKDEQARTKQLELQQALERSQADVNALQRELLRVNKGGR